MGDSDYDKGEEGGRICPAVYCQCVRGGEGGRGGSSNEEDDNNGDEVNGDKVSGDVLQWRAAT